CRRNSARYGTTSFATTCLPPTKRRPNIFPRTRAACSDRSTTRKHGRSAHACFSASTDKGISVTIPGTGVNAERIRELEGVNPRALPDEVLASTEPLVLRGLAADWPMVRAALESPAAATAYLRHFYKD